MFIKSSVIVQTEGSTLFVPSWFINLGISLLDIFALAKTEI